MFRKEAQCNEGTTAGHQKGTHNDVYLLDKKDTVLQVAFEWIEVEGTFRTWVLDKACLDKTFFPGRYFHELHGHMWAYKFKSIANPSAPEPPFRRLMHTILMAGCIKARQLGVLPPGVNPEVDKLYFSGAKV